MHDVRKTTQQRNRQIAIRKQT